MSWTSPITYTVGQTLTAAQMNTYVRDNTLFLFSPPACSVQRTGDGTFASGSSLNGVGFNVASDYDTDPTMHSAATNNSRITINTGGLYKVSGGGKWAISSAGARYMAIRRNGTHDLCNDSRIPLASDNSWQNVTRDMLISVGDYVELCVAQTSGSGLALLGSVEGGAWLTVAWLGRGI